MIATHFAAISSLLPAVQCSLEKLARDINQFSPSTALERERVAEGRVRALYLCNKLLLDLDAHTAKGHPHPPFGHLLPQAGEGEIVLGSS